MVSGSAYITLGVSDLAGAIALFEGVMKLKQERAFEASQSLRKAWKLPSGTKARIVELSCRGYPFGRLRLVQHEPVPTQKVRIHSGPLQHDGAADVGCKAVDFYVAAPIRPIYDAIVAAGYETRSEPVLHEVGETISEEFVFWGPDGVPLLLMVGHRHDADQLRPGSPDGPFSEVATVSVVGDAIDATRAFYEGVLGLNLVIDESTQEEFLEGVNRLTGTPPGTQIRWLLYAGRGEPSGKILVVHFIGANAARLTGRMRPAHLGFSLLTHYSRDLDALESRLRTGGYRVETPPTVVDMAGTQTRLMLAIGPNEEMFEFIEKELP